MAIKISKISAVGGIEPTKPTTSNKINVTDKGATPKPYPKTMSKSIDKKGNEVVTIVNSDKKEIFKGNSRDVNTKKEVQVFKKDSTGYANSANYDAKDFNLKKVYAVGMKKK